MISKGSLEVRDIDEIITREEGVSALCIALYRAGFISASMVYRLRWSV